MKVLELVKFVKLKTAASQHHKLLKNIKNDC